ncbi:hypothetical protein QD46_07785 [Paenibacillus polymyxa]|uniref:hypothetical protein n=1 Tax=Paenibacillus polymyxa TaxID=1406 RepID=UPI0005CDD7DC|nr:hypothetical protein [Paenibacillus polymyxa]KJD40539.1 hypothetical protein QD46_07785 [Paenibacillus polymyxa]
MIPTLSNYLQTSNGTLTWSETWIRNFESPWSVFEKVKLMNIANKRDIFNLFAVEKLQKQRTIIAQKYHDFYLLSAFDDKKLQDKLGFQIRSYSVDLLEHVSGFLKNGKFFESRKGKIKNVYWRDSLFFCPECLKEGYHSILHQFKLFDKCPFHVCPLISHCPQCQRSVPYKLSDNFPSPYTCECGYCYCNTFELKANYFYHNNSLDINFDPYKKWLEMNQHTKKKLSSIYTYPSTNIGNKSNLLNQLFELIGEHNFSENDTSSTYVTVFSAPYIHNLKDSELKKMKCSDYLWSPINSFSLEHGFNDSPLKKRILKELIHVKMQIFSSLSKHLKNTILEKHKSCIHRYVNVIQDSVESDPPVCPYAFSYVKWKQIFYKLNHYYNVDNRPFNGLEATLGNLNFIAYLDEDPLTEVIDACLEEIPHKIPEKIIHLKWISAHMTAFFGLHIFNQILFHVAQNSFKNELSLFNEIDSQILFQIQLTGDRLSLQVMKDYTNYHQKILSELKCPYSSVKSKRKSSTQSSYHPMLVAINKSDQRKYD